MRIETLAEELAACTHVQASSKESRMKTQRPSASQMRPVFWSLCRPLKAPPPRWRPRLVRSPRKSPTWPQGCWRLVEHGEQMRRAGFSHALWQVEGNLDFVRESELPSGEAGSLGELRCLVVPVIQSWHLKVTCTPERPAPEREAWTLSLAVARCGFDLEDRCQHSPAPCRHLPALPSDQLDPVLPCSSRHKHAAGEAGSRG